MDTTDVGTIILAAGRGERFDNNCKQFKSIFHHGIGLNMVDVNLMKYQQYSAEIVLVVPHKSWLGYKLLGFDDIYHSVVGGNTRIESLINGFQKFAENEKIKRIVIVDAVRPFTSRELIETVLAESLNHDVVVPVCPCHETILINKRLGIQHVNVDRDNYVICQNPTVWNKALLHSAINRIVEYGDNGQHSMTNHAVEHYPDRVKFVESTHENMKITFPHEFAIFEHYIWETEEKWESLRK